MKEHPILFSTPMVKALLNGNKTMTRRSTGLDKINHNPDNYFFPLFAFKASGKFIFAPKGNFILTNPDVIEVKCPYGKPGDLLWVRETWQHTKILNLHPTDENYGFVYKADEQPWQDMEGLKWKPSIHMPKAAARIWLRIKDVRIERLWKITEEDAKAEGAEYFLWRIVNDPRPYVNGFASVWFAINGKASWNKNPWVWVVSFEVMSTTGKPM
ncbi:MAG: hypothetical protein EOM47_14705 [Bacteroidia bacterium]|nr:hypothetical protein [Bacteroidia bacterium]